MNSPNAGWLFYKNYYMDIPLEYYQKKAEYISKKKEESASKKVLENIKNEASSLVKKMYETKNKKLLKSTFTSMLDKKGDLPTIPYNHSFELTTTYPGLLLGSGYTHETGEEGEFKLGFFFDYTTGEPVIPGSSVKGILRSAFKHPEYIRELIADGKKDIFTLEKEIFCGIRNETNVSVYDRDIFYDAVITSRAEIFAEDYITPHKDALKNPIPLKFLKIKPGVIFKFAFSLTDKGLLADKKKELFKRILLDLGAGAKTNVGYGQFVENTI